MKTVHQQRGIALITALLVVAIATIAAVEMASRQRFDLRRLENMLAYDQAYSYALSAEPWAMGTLKADLFGGNSVDHPGEVWAQPGAVPEYKRAQIVMQVEDLQGRFNLNNLSQVDPDKPLDNLYYRQFMDLLKLIKIDDPDLELQNPAAIADALADWLDADLDPRIQGAEDQQYLTPREDGPTYRAGNRLMHSPTELRLVNGVTPEIYAALAPYITALPQPTPINLNTAPPMLLRLANPKLDMKAAEDLIDQRPEETGWTTADEFFQLPAMAGVPVAQGTFGVKSHYFVVHTDVTLDPAHVKLHSLIHRGDDVSLRVIQRALGDL